MKSSSNMERITTNRKDQPTCHILASQQGYFPDLNRFDSICFHIFKGDDYTLALPINSPSGAQGRESHQIEEDHQLIIGETAPQEKKGGDAYKRAPQAETSSQSTVRSLIQRPFKRNTSLFRVTIP